MHTRAQGYGIHAHGKPKPYNSTRVWHSQTDKNDMDEYNNVSYTSGNETYKYVQYYDDVLIYVKLILIMLCQYKFY